MSFRLYNHQVLAVDKLLPIMKQHNMAYFHAAERFGKTLVVLELADRLLLDKVLIVTAKKAIPSIVEDYKLGGYDSKFRLEVTNYESVHKVLDVYQLIVFDEAHKMSSLGRMNKTVKAVIKMRDRANPTYMIGMSATPVSETPGGWYHQFKVLGYAYPHNMRTHNIAHQVMGEPHQIFRAGGMLTETYKHWKPEFYNLFTKYIVHMDRAHAEFDVPEATIVREVIDMDAENESFYRAVQTSDVHNNLVVDSDIKRFSKLRQLAGGTIIMDDDEVEVLGLSKANWISDNTSDMKKVAIYCYYKAEIKLLNKIFDACEDPNDFKVNDKQYLVMQTHSGSLGIDLSFCDIHIMYSITYSGSAWSQACNRQLNKARTTAANVHVLVSKGTIEEDAYTAVSAKRDFNISSFREHERGI